jgi:pyruvate,water dikinase
MGEYIFLLGSEDAAASLIGTKAANLNDLARADFRVPPAFVVTTHAFRRLITYNDLKSRIAALEQQGVFAQIRSLFKGAEMPEDLRHEIVSAYRELGAAGKVAVRSSAAAEDLPDASFAGQMDTFLNVSGEGALIESIIACFSSFWTDRAMAYRNNRQLDPTQSGHAVIVQHMVAADISGILFTVNPVSGDACEMIINAAHGSGEAIVSGEVTPDNIVVDSSSGRVKSVESGNRQQALRNDQIGGLVRLGRALEKHFGRPQDVEWAIWKEVIYAIQSRPVTSNRNLVQCPGDDNWPACGKFSPQPFDRWSRANVGEMWPDPVSPLVWSTIPDIVSEAVRFSLRGVRSKSLQQAQWAARFYGRVYYNEGALERVLTHELGLPPSFMDKSRGSSQERGDASNDRTHIGRVLLHAPVLLRLALRQRQTGRALETQLLKVDQWVSGFNLEEQKKKTDRQLLEDALCWVERVKQTLNLQYEMSGISLTAAAALERLMMRWFKRDGLAQELITGLSGIQAAEMGADLWAITRKLKSERLEGIVLTMHASEALKELRRNDKARSVSALLDDFIEHHGHRCPNEAEWLYPAGRTRRNKSLKSSPHI